MPRWAVAIASLTALVASFALASFVLRDRSGSSGTPALAQRPAPAAPARPVDLVGRPQPAEPAPDPQADDSETLRAWARDAEQREQALREAILNPPGSEGATLDVQLDLYRGALRAALEGTPREWALEHRGMLTEVFLRRESVQAELAALGPSARQKEINHIRRQMGYDEEEIARLEELDARREARWRNGLAYMEERRRVVESFEGEALDQELRHLRDRYFAHEAKTIELEEESGFFRYERPRVYGRN